ncbi:MAG: carboxymuconolactone decarboxylase family protein [Betaproteobacteria bacterium]|nr:carboxymuconolactone decarboxylase family protein [Betaproteobacteria bacterium]MBI2292330.1 carboxymuconolactone decarboxylase family protein [Betaproteobacteria bacterium]
MADDLCAKYGDLAYDSGLKQQSKAFERRLAERDALDQHFTKLWLDFAVTGMGRRQVLDTRTRLLVLTGQFTMSKSHEMLEETIQAAINAGVKAREVLEIILQCAIYGGQVAVDPAIRIFYRFAKENGLLEALRASQLPMDGTASQRNYEEELKKWHPGDLADPRCEPLLKRHGWLAVGTGLRLRPKHHLNTLGWQDALDPEWAGLWVRYIYGGMYTRGILDDRTRLLCMVGNCVAVNEAVQGRAHMKGAMRAGAKPREVLEVILQSAVNFGQPGMLHSLKIFVELMAKEGRLAEIGDPPQRENTD